MNPIEELILNFQNLVAQVPELVQPFIVLLAGAVPFIEGEGAAIIGVVGGIFPITAAIAAAAGNFLSVLIVVLVGTDIMLSLIKRWLPRVDRLLEGQPLVILRDGVPLRSRMRIERLDEEDILTAARESQGIDRLEDIERAVLERNGGISIVPRRGVDS